MVDLIVEKYCNQFTIYEIRNGKKERTYNTQLCRCYRLYK